MKNERINLVLLLFPICIVGIVLPFFSEKSVLNDYIDLHIYGFIISSFIAGIFFQVFNLKKRYVFAVNYLTISVLLISLFLLFHNLFTSSGNRLDTLYIIAFVTLFFLFESDQPKHIKIISILIIIICIGEVLYGIGQFLHFVGYTYIVKGSFDNAAGFAALLSMGVCFCFSLFSYSRKYKIIGIVALIIIIPAIVFSASRAGILSTTIVILYYLVFRFKTLIVSNRRAVIPLCLVLFLLLGTHLFFMKKDSATGRMLIWQNTCQIIKQNPLWGSGKNSFQTNYMLYQAEYFAENPESRYVLLADNVIRPFNEYLSFACEYGLIAFLLLIGVVWIIFKFLPADFSPYFGVVIGFMVFSCFSYPLYYPVVLMIGVYSLAGISGSLPVITYFCYGSLLKGCLSLLLALGISVGVSSIRFELQWKELIRLCSLGKGKEVLEDYKYLYNKWNGNPYFLYNYGAQLNYSQEYEESLYILHECEKYFNDYDVQLLLAYNYYRIQDYESADKHYSTASNMCPNRFIPLSYRMKIYIAKNEYEKAREIANHILNKEIKIPSFQIERIKKEAQKILSNDIIP